MRILAHIGEKIKLFTKEHFEEIGVSAVIILVAFASFYLGRASLSSPASHGGGVSVEESLSLSSTSTQAATAQSALGTSSAASPQGGQLVASKNGKKYYYPWCSGVSRISPANKIYFASAAEAESFGLSIASGCAAH